MFTGVLVKKIQAAASDRNEACTDTEIACLPELGITPAVLQSLYEREREAQLGQVQMNCQLCKFRIAASESAGNGHSHHSHHRHHGHDRSEEGHHHGHPHGAAVDPYAKEPDYHQRIWTVP